MSLYFRKGVSKLLSEKLIGVKIDNLSDDELLSVLSQELEKNEKVEEKVNTVIESIEKISIDTPVFLGVDKGNSTESVLHSFLGGMESSTSSVIHLQEVINCVPEMIFVLDNHFKIIEVNEAVHIILHKKEEPIVGRNVLDFVVERELMIGLLEDRFLNEEFTFLNRLHDEVPTTVNIERLRRGGGEKEGYVLVAVDQRVNKSREKTLIKERKKAEELTQAKTDFLSVMSHEIRTPLNAVIGLSEILGNKSPRKDQLELIETLKFSGENLTSLINDILDYSKIDAGKIVLESIPIDLNEISKNVHKSLIFKAEENQNVIVLNCPKKLPIIYGDRVRIVQILTNLIGNSIKFTKNGEIVVSILEVKSDNGVSTISFSVMDTGVGIAEAKLSDIFDEFSQAETGTTRKFGGTGLGLTITKNLIHLHKSEIHVKSTIGFGTNFYFDIDFDHCSEEVEQSEENYEFKSVVDKRILLAEDNAVNVMVASNFLDQLKVTFDVAENGEEALHLALNNEYDLILMDLQMPVMDGFESAQKIISHNIKTPIIALSASALIEDKVQATEAGMVDFISKPFKSEELNKKILMYT